MFVRITTLALRWNFSKVLKVSGEQARSLTRSITAAKNST
jgi:hypothetical protein